MTADQPGTHFAVLNDDTEGHELYACWPYWSRRRTITSVAANSRTRKGHVIYRVHITADLNDEDDTGFVWTFLTPGALVLAGG